jgi:hypothetical protein
MDGSSGDTGVRTRQAPIVKITFLAPALGAVAVGAALVLAPVASANTDPRVPYGTDPQPPNLGYYESNSGTHSAGDTALGSLDLPF